MVGNTTVNTSTIKNAVLVLSNGLMAESTSASGATVSNMAKAFISIDIKKKEEVLGTKGSELIGLILVLESKNNRNQKTKNDY